MAQSNRNTIEARGAQMFPVLSEAQAARMRRFGEPRHFKDGDFLVRAGEPADGLHLILSGQVRIRPHETHTQVQDIVVHGPGNFMGELAQLSGRPSLVDGIAIGDVETILLPPPRLRDLLVEEAELGELVMRALILRRVGLLEQGVGVIIIGHAGNGDVLRLAGFLDRNGFPHQDLDPASDNCARTLVERFQVGEWELPIVLCLNGELLRNPTENALAHCLGMSPVIDENRVFDVAVVGAGPAGLAAAVYAASEGLSAIVLDCRAFGGQAGASARIENYLGFPTGITGIALMARAFTQAQKFGAEMAIPEEVISLDDGSEDCRFVLLLNGGAKLKARTIVIATGAQYRRLDVDNLSEFEGAHVHYWASPLEGRLCAGQEVALVGGGNSAGQAAVYLASQVKKVFMVVRGKSLEATMSRYLCERIAAQPNIEVIVESEIIKLGGNDGQLQTLTCRNRSTGKEATHDIRHLFLFIGAEPNTAWLARSDIELDGKGFVCADALAGKRRYPFETSRDGIFAIGDVRSGSVKRVAASVGEGAQVVATLHAFLADTEQATETPGTLSRVRAHA